MSGSQGRSGRILAALGVRDVLEAEPVSGGWDTELWRVQTAEGTFALRLLGGGQAERATREVRAMRLAAEGGVAVPTVHAQGTWEARPALLLDWIPGQTLAEALVAPGADVARLGRLFGEELARIHRVEAAPRDDGQPWIAFGADGALAERLRAVARGGCLLHLDYHPLNVMVDAGRISGVIDWANALHGDPRADLARTASILRLSSIAPSAGPSRRRLLLDVFLPATYAGYESLTGSLERMELFHAWAASAMIADLSPKLGRPGVWLGAEHMATLERWRREWFGRAGVSIAAGAP